MTNVASLLPQAISLLQAADNLGAAAVLERLVAADPNDAMMRARLATAYLRAVVQTEPDDPAEAERLLLRVLELDVMHENARQSYAKFLRRHGRHLEAAQHPGEVPAAGSDELEMHFQLGAKAYRARDYAASADYLEQVLAADPRHSRAMSLLPGACYRAGRLNHPSLDPARRELSGQVRFADGLNMIARAIGVEAAADGGGLPDRAGWTEAQRYDWGRRVDALIRYQVLGGPDTLADLQRFTQPFALPPDLREGGAVILLLHVGSVSLAIGQIVASGIPYSLVTNSISYGLAYPNRVIDALKGGANSLLAQMGMALRRRVCVAVAADGPLGKRVDGFEHKGSSTRSPRVRWSSRS